MPASSFHLCTVFAWSNRCTPAVFHPSILHLLPALPVAAAATSHLPGPIPSACNRLTYVLWCPYFPNSQVLLPPGLEPTSAEVRCFLRTTAFTAVHALNGIMMRSARCSTSLLIWSSMRARASELFQLSESAFPRESSLCRSSTHATNFRPAVCYLPCVSSTGH